MWSYNKLQLSLQNDIDSFYVAYIFLLLHEHRTVSYWYNFVVCTCHRPIKIKN